MIAEADTLEDRRERLARRFFRRSVLNESLCLHYLLKPNEVQKTLEGVQFSDSHSKV